MAADGSVEELKKSQDVGKENRLSGASEVIVLNESSCKAPPLMRLNENQSNELEMLSVSQEVSMQVEEEVKGESENKTLADSSVFDASPAGQKRSPTVVRSNDKGVVKPVKRKRASIDVNTDKESLLAECHRELDYLFEYYKELSAQMLTVEEGTRLPNNSLIACLLEESNLSLSKLMEMIYERLKGKEGITLASVRSAILSTGQRTPYGIINVEADLLEDESESCLWCWETRDMKLLPANRRGELNIRRVGRKKIHERISALSETLSALPISETQDNHKSNLIKASMKLGKTLNAEEIHSFIERKKQKNDSGMAEKAAKQKEKESIREIQKEKTQSEKEIKRLQEETEKEAKRQEKEEVEFKKQLKKQQEEAERDRRRREKAEAELKAQRSVKKQATIMERFLKTKKSKNNSDNVHKQSEIKDLAHGSPCKVDAVNATTSLMDGAFSGQDSLSLEDLRKLHVDGWHNLSRLNRSCHWSVRKKPKTELFKELKLHESAYEDSFGKAEAQAKEVVSCRDLSHELSLNKLVYGPGRSFLHDNTDIASPPVRSIRKKLLQFDKSNRPAYYGTWSKKSCAVGPRHPFKKDPDLGYEVDSDEEWEEDEPGESLSDCEKDSDEVEEENLKLEDEEESEDGFFVPDGYLSENEGVQIDQNSDVGDDEPGSSLCGQSEIESEEIRLMLQQQKTLQSLTQQALKKSQPLIISNLMHEKSEIKLLEDGNGTHKIDQICLQALCMKACPGGCIIDVAVEPCPRDEDQEVAQSQSKSNITSTPNAATISDSDLQEFVSSIRSNSQGINKVLESLQGKFPAIPKSQLRNKVREISDYVDNRWKVKKEILEKLGLSPSPDKKAITTFFSKRCQLPPEQDFIKVPESSPVQGSKTNSVPPEDTPSSNAFQTSS